MSVRIDTEATPVIVATDLAVFSPNGDGVKERKNLLVRIGTQFSEVLAFCGGIVITKDRNDVATDTHSHGLSVQCR